MPFSEPSSGAAPSDFGTASVPEAAGADPVAPGSTIGRYAIERELGRGGMGVVYAAREAGSGRRVALKLLARGLDGAADRQRFLREGEMAAAIDDPHVVYVYRTEELAGRPAIAMELVDGGTLEEKLAQRGPLPWDEAIRDILQVIAGLEAAARHGILHRDIKPSNIFVGPHGALKVGDFGLSRPVEPVAQLRLTQTGMFVGTPVCSSPEQLLGEALDVRSDLYAVGATFYYLLTGAYPYDADNAARLIARVMSEKPAPLARHRRDVPAAVEAILMRCLARERDGRWDTYADLRAALEAQLPERWAPATPARRFAAGAFDFGVLGLAWKTGRIVVMGTAWVSDHAVLSWLTNVLVLWVGLGLMEGVLGFTPGKRLLGVRVVGRGGGVPGWRAGVARGTLFSADALIKSALVASGLVGAEAASNQGGWLFALLLAGLFARIRPGNGWRGEHDRWTGTRVVMANTGDGALLAERPPVAALRTVPAEIARVGEYAVTGRLESPDLVLLARDPRLGRAVWLVAAAPHASHTPHEATLRSARPSAPRFLEVVETGEGVWEAYAATGGERLADRLRRPCPWPVVRRWLSDLATETARHTQGVPQQDAPGGRQHGAPVSAAGRLLVTADEQLLWLPFRYAPAGPSPAAAGGNGTGNGTGNGAGDGEAGHEADPLGGSGADAVGALARAVLARPWPEAADELPLHARRLLATLAAAPPDADAVRAAVEATEPVSGAVSRAMRLNAALLLAGFALANEGYQWARQDGARREARAIEAFTAWIGTNAARSPAAQGDQDAFATFLASRFAQPAASDSARRRRLADTRERLTPRQAQTFDSLLLARPRPSAADSGRAERRILGELRGAPAGWPDRRIVAGLTGVAIVQLLTVLLALVAAAVARRGTLLRALRLDLMDRHGAPAPRWRRCVRLLPALAIGTAGVWGGTAVQEGEWAGVWLMAVAGAALVLWGYSVWRTPGRSVLERLSGTWMVRA